MSTHSGFSMQKAKAASFKPAAFSSNKTQSMEGDSANTWDDFAKVDQGEPGRFCPYTPVSQGPVTGKSGAPLWELMPAGPGPAAAEPGSMVPTAWFIEKVRAAATIFPMNAGLAP